MPSHEFPNDADAAGPGATLRTTALGLRCPVSSLREGERENIEKAGVHTFLNALVQGDRGEDVTRPLQNTRVVQKCSLGLQSCVSMTTLYYAKGVGTQILAEHLAIPIVTPKLELF